MLKYLQDLALDFIAFAESAADGLEFVNTFMVAIVLVALTTLTCAY